MPLGAFLRLKFGGYVINIKEIKETIFSKWNDIYDYENEPIEFVQGYGLREGDAFWAGVQELINPSQFFSIDSLMEQMQTNADESEFSEWSEDYLIDLDKEILKTLDEKISMLLDEHLPKPIFHYVVDTVKYRIVKIDGDDVFVELVKESV